MNKIEAVVPRSVADVLLTKTGNDGMPLLPELSIVESQSRFCKLRSARSRETKWEPCVKVDLFVPDYETQSTVDLILQHSNLPQSGGGHVNIIPIEAALEISGRQSRG
jgi:nitrogen regulatory protein PII